MLKGIRLLSSVLYIALLYIPKENLPVPQKTQECGLSLVLWSEGVMFQAFPSQTILEQRKAEILSGAKTFHSS